MRRGDPSTAQPKRLEWCECLLDIPKFYMELDRAIGINDWAVKNGRTAVTRGAKDAATKAHGHLKDIVVRCGLPVPVGTQNKISEARSGLPLNAAGSLRSVRTEVNSIIQRQCSAERAIVAKERGWG